jgi:GntR family transcriptional regulator, arabinose operon transcriptional repressor
LAHQFKVSRITIKKALDDLVEKGIIYRIQGKGSFVSMEAGSEPMVYQHDPSFKRGKMVALLMPRVDARYNTAILSEIEKTLNEQGYTLIFCQTQDSQQLEQIKLKQVLDLGVEGIIIYPVEGETYNEEVLKLTLEGFPLVLIDRYFRGIDANSVCSDNFQGAYDATRHLLNLGHNRIGIISTEHHGTTSIEDRILGYEKALTDYKTSIDQRLYLLNLEILKKEDNKKKIQEFLRKNPDMTAVFAISNGICLLDAAEELGIDIPKDLSTVMFDDYDLADFMQPSPTCIQQNEKEIGKKAADLLVSTIEDPKLKRQKILVPIHLQVRNSTTKSSSHYKKEASPGQELPG